MAFRLIDEIELEGFYAAVRANGQRPEDFDLTEKVESAIGVEKGSAIVRSKKSGVERFYPIGHETIFPADFIQELEQGAFR
jgi:hypothetical protein